MNSLIIRVKHKTSEIFYHQETKDTLSNAATTTDGYSKASSQKILLETIKSMCSNIIDIERKIEMQISGLSDET